jgi:antitoxin YefM
LLYESTKKYPHMPTQTTYTDARAHLAEYMDATASTREPIIIHRRNGEDVALIALSELESLMETAHLLRSPRNAERLMSALARARAGEGEIQGPEDLRREMGLEGG